MWSLSIGVCTPMIFMTDNMFLQPIRPLDDLLREKRMPVLFIGSGVSQRYCSLCGWNALLLEISNTIGISKIQLNAIRSQLEVDHPDNNVNPMVASVLSKIMRSKLANGELKRNDFKNLEDDDWALMEKIDPFKVLVSSITSKIKIKQDEQIQEEIESFKKISNKVPAVITTNYDNFLETYVFTDFSVLVYPDDYYFNSSSGYDEILKIHGSVSDPKSIVITQEDYLRLQKESKVITSRITSLMCQNPMIFIGYSISDDEIHDVILDLVSSLKQTELDMIRGHLIKISVRPELHKSKWSPRTETFQGKKIEVTQLDVPNLTVLFRYLDKFTPVATPHEIRKYQEMIRDIVLSTDSNARKVELIDIEDLDHTRSGDLAVIIGKSSSIGSMMKGILGYEATDVICDVLLNRTGILDASSTHFTQWFSQNRICKENGFVPVFYYILKFRINEDELNQNSKAYIERSIPRLEQKLTSMKGKCSTIFNLDQIDSFLSKQIKSFPKCEALAYFQHIGLISREECRLKLVDIYREDLIQFGGSIRIKSELRAAVMMLDYDEYKKRTETCTLSH